MPKAKPEKVVASQGGTRNLRIDVASHLGLEVV